MLERPPYLGGGDLHQPQILFSGKTAARLRRKIRRSDGLHKELGHLFGGFGVDHAIHADHSAKRRNRVSLQCLLESLGESSPRRRAARIGVLDDGAHRLLEFLRQLPGGFQVDDVVVRKLLALKLFPTGHAASRAIGVHRSFLVGILAITQVSDFIESQSQGRGKTIADDWFFVAMRQVGALQRGSDCRIVRGGQCEGLLG